MFIAVDGIDGAGKTTLVRQLVTLIETHHVVTVTKEPTDRSRWGQKLRAAARSGRLPREKEIEYFHLDRVRHIEEVIQPALDAGKVVISDRYVDSMLAFQTDSPEEADALYERLSADIIVPDLTFILDCAVETGLGRIKRNREGFSEYEKREVLERARLIYLSRKGDHYVHLDAEGTPASTFKQAEAVLNLRFREANLAWIPSPLEKDRDGYGCLPAED